MEGQVNNNCTRRLTRRLQTARKSTATLTPEARLTQRLIWAHEEIRRLQRMLFRYQRHNYILMNRLDWCERERAGISHERDSPESPEPSERTPAHRQQLASPRKQPTSELIKHPTSQNQQQEDQRRIPQRIGAQLAANEEASRTARCQGSPTSPVIID